MLCCCNLSSKADYLCSMAKEIKPIKRSKQLTPLSKDHHDGLLFAFKIKQGLKNGTDVKLVAEYVQWFWKNHLHEHFVEEEQILAPYLPADNDLLKQMMEEHENIEAMIRINEEIPDKCICACSYFSRVFFLYPFHGINHIRLS